MSFRSWTGKIDQTCSCEDIMYPSFIQRSLRALLRGGAMTPLLLSPLAFSAALAPSQSLACACGCGVFDAGPTSLMPTNSDSGYSVWFRYSYLDQNHNWEGSAKAPNSDNGDQHIETNFYTFGGQDMINRDWTVMAELPVFNRQLTTTDDGNGDATGNPNSVYNAKLTAPGDAKIMGVYTGFSPDMSIGVLGGVKLPTGDWHGPNGAGGGPEFDRDSLPGTGSTDLMFGGYYTDGLNADGSLSYYVQATYQFAVLTQQNYRPGNEIDGAAGLIYSFGSFGRITKVAPVLSLISSVRNHDNGANSDPLNSGYQRLFIAPGIEVAMDKVNLYADIEIPIYQYTNSAQSVNLEGTSGQLVAPFAVKVQLGYSF
jgi:hypothetical protein